MHDRLSRYVRQSSSWQRGTLLLIVALLIVDVGLFLYGGADGTSSLWTSKSQAQQASTANEIRSQLPSGDDPDAPAGSEGASTDEGEFVSDDGGLASSRVPSGAVDSDLFGAAPILLPDGSVLGTDGDLGEASEGTGSTAAEGDGGGLAGTGGTGGADADEGNDSGETGGTGGDDTTPGTTQAPTPLPTTPPPTTPEPPTAEPTTPEPPTAEPTTPEPTTPEPTEPQPTEPEPPTAEPTEPEPTEPEATEDEPGDDEEAPAPQP